MSADLNTLAGGAPAGTVEVEELPRWRRRLTLVVPPDRVRRERRRVTREYARRARIPGFRPGHVPEDLVHKRFRTEIEEDLARALLREALREGLRERNLDPVSPPVVQSLSLEDDTLRATAEVDVRPELALSRTGGFRIERPDPSLPPDAVDRVLERLREERAEVRPVEHRAAAAGDIVVADVEPLDGRSAPIEGYTTLLGSGQAGPAVEAGLAGALPGQEREVVVEEAGGGGGGPGTPASTLVQRRYRLRVREVRERLLPALDDAFAAAVSASPTLEALRERLGENLRAEADARAERELRDRLLDAIAEANPVEVPVSMVEDYVHRMLRPAGHDQGEHDHARGHDHAHGHDRAGDAERPWTEEDERVAEVLRPAAERALRRHLILEAVAREAAFEPTDGQLDAYLRERLEEGRSVAAARRALERDGRLEELRARLRADNVFEHLKRQSTILPAGEAPAR